MAKTQDQDAIIGHDQSEIPIENTVDDFGNTALLLAKDQQDDRVEKRTPNLPPEALCSPRGKIDV